MLSLKYLKRMISLMSDLINLKNYKPGLLQEYNKRIM